MECFNIIDFGAVGDGTVKNTQVLQKTIDLANAENGTVVIPAGVFLTGSLNLKGVSLYLEKGAVLKGSSDIRDYPYIGYYHNEMQEVTSLLYSMHSRGVHIYGEGTIDFNGTSFYNQEQLSIPEYYKKPLTEEQRSECNYTFEERVNQPVFFEDAEDVVIEGITLLDSSCWTLSFSHCRKVRLLNLTIDTNWKVPNNDGIHVSSSSDVIIRGCNISTGDDCIALTCITDWEGICENVIISDCVLRTCSKAVAIGYMYSRIRNVTVTNCVIQESNRGICIMASAGQGCVEDVIFSNLVIDTKIRAGNWWGNGEPFYILGIRHDTDLVTYFEDSKPERKLEYSVRRIVADNLICRGENALGIVGEKGNVKEITLSNIFFQAKKSKNIELMGRVIDTNPSFAFIPVEEDCFLKIVGAEQVGLHNVNGDEENQVNRIVME